MKYTYNLQVPGSWSELTQDQLIFLLRLVAADVDQDSVIFRCLLRFSGLRFESGDREGCVSLFSFRPPATQGLSGRLRLRCRQVVSISDQALTGWMSLLDKFRTVPDFPVRPEFSLRDGLPLWRRLRRRVPALDAMFTKVPFALFLAAEAHYRQALSSLKAPMVMHSVMSSEPLSRLVGVLYPGYGSRHVSGVMRIAAVYWMAGLKAALVRLYPDLYSPSGEDGSKSQSLWNPAGNNQGLEIKRSTEAMVRALTQGDPLRREAILALDTHTALAELDAIARENARLNSMAATN